MVVEYSDEIISNVVVMKFGGSSLKDSKMMQVVSEIVQTKLQQGLFPIIVCSAMGKTTNELIAAGSSVSTESTRPHIENISPVNRLSTNYVDAFLSKVATLHRTTMTELSTDATTKAEIETLLVDAGSILNGVKLVRELSERTRDLLMSFGERLSVRILASLLNSKGIRAQARDAWEIGIRTCKGTGSIEHDHGTATLLPETPASIRAALSGLIAIANRAKKEGKGPYDYMTAANTAGSTNFGEVAPTFTIPVVTGFIAMDTDGAVTTLGRGGSDFTAATIGAAIRCSEVEIWTDVDGILTADPRVVPQAKHIPQISFREASEFAYFGARVLHPMTIRPAVERGVTVRVVNTFNPTHEGTSIKQDTIDLVVGRNESLKHLRALSQSNLYRPEASSSEESIASPQRPTPSSDRSRLVKAITCKKDVILVDIYSTNMIGNHGFLARVFDIFEREQLSIDVIATGEASLSMTLDKGANKESMQRAAVALQKFTTHVEVQPHKSIVTLLCNTFYSSEVLANACAVFAQNQQRVDMVSCGASRVNISFVLAENVSDEVIRQLHVTLIEREEPLPVPINNAASQQPAIGTHAAAVASSN